MKTTLHRLAGIILFACLLAPFSRAAVAANDLILTQRNAANNNNTTVYLTSTSSRLLQFNAASPAVPTLSLLSVSPTTGAISGFVSGTAAAPSIAFEPDTGFFLSGANAIGVSTDGVERWIFNASGSFVPLIDNAYDIGNGTVNPRDIHAARNGLFGGVLTAGTGPTTLTDAAGKILSAALNTVEVANGGTGATTAAGARTNLALGTADSPTFAGLTVAGANPISGNYTTATTAAAVFPLDVKVTVAGQAASGYAQFVRFLLRDDSGVDNVLGYIGFARNGADNAGALDFYTNNGGSPTFRLRVNAAGTVIVGSSTADNSIGLLQVQGDIGTTSVFRSTGGFKRCATQFDKTSDTTLGNATDLSVTLTGGITYSFEAEIYTASAATGGVKFALGGTATFSSINYEAVVWNAATTVAQTRAAALGTAVGGVTAVTAAMCKITGTGVCTNGGTVTVQFAQNASDGTASSVLVGSHLRVLGF